MREKITSENVFAVFSDNCESSPSLAKSLRNITVSSKRVTTVLRRCEALLATPNGIFSIEKCSAYILTIQ